MNIKRNKTVLLGMSGGVDSSVAAYLLKEAGHKVIGIFMKNWTDDSVIKDAECPWVQDSNDALMVADKLGIPYYVVDFTDEYKRDIVDYMFDSYANGLTPNPDVLCNYHIKFGHFLNQAKKLNADYVATGHYAGIDVDEKGNLYVTKAKDDKKDQSYFLCRLTQDQLKHAMFPLSNLTKSEVRKIAEENDLITANKKDSQGLCFVGKIKLSEFLSQKLKPKAGICVDVNTNQIVGQHKGAHFFTRGQSKGIGVSGQSTKYYVAKKDVEDNILYVTNNRNDDSLNDNVIHIKNINFFNSKYDKLEFISNVNIQYTYHGKIYTGSRLMIDGNFYGQSKGRVIKEGTKFYAPEKGQFLVGYGKNGRILFSGEIY